MWDQTPPDVEVAADVRYYSVVLREGVQEELCRASWFDPRSFEKLHKELEGQGYVLEDFEIVKEGTEFPVFGLWYLWDRGSSPPRQHLELRLSQESFAATDEEARGRDLFPADVETYPRGGDGEEQRWLAALWIEGPERELSEHLSRAELLKLAQKRAVVDLESWLSTDGRRYLAVYSSDRLDDPPPKLLPDLPEFHAEGVKGLLREGYRPLELEIYGDADGNPLYSSIWERSEDAAWLFTGTGGSGAASQDCRLVSLGIELTGLLSAKAVACCRELSRGDASEPDEAVSSARSPSAERSSTLDEELERSAADPATTAATAQSGCLSIHRKQVPSESLRIVDLVVTRQPLRVIEPTHPDVPHDEGATVP